MSNQGIKGVVDRVWTKTKSTRVGDKTIHYATVDGVEFSTGFKQPFSEGEAIDIQVKFNYGELQYQPNAGPSAGAAPATNKPAPVTKGNFKGNRGSFPIDPNDGQMSIIRQSSMDRAVTLVRDMVTAGTVEAPASKEEYLKLCIEIALNITDYASGNDIMQLKQAMKEAV
jgi:hypothetical protein